MCRLAVSAGQCMIWIPLYASQDLQNKTIVFLRLAPRLTASVVSMSIEQPTHNPYHSCSSTDQLENNCNREHKIENY